MSALHALWKSSPASARVGMIIILAWLVAGVFADILAPYGETEVVPNAVVWAEWSAATPLGTDQLGRDLLTRILYGARNTIFIALLTTGLALSLIHI